MTAEEIDRYWTEEWESIWKPALQTIGVFDEAKIRAELHDLVFIYKQVSAVYGAMTGEKLTKPMYFAGPILAANAELLRRTYELGFNDAMKDNNK